MIRQICSVQIVCILTSSAFAQTPTLDYALAFTVGFSPAATIEAMTSDVSGNTYLTGTFSGMCDFDPGPGAFDLFAPPNESHVFVTKLGPQGDLIWARQYNSDCMSVSRRSIATDVFGNIFIAGSFQCEMDFDPGPGIQVLSSVGGNMYITKLNPMGDFAWVRQLGNGAVDMRGIQINGTDELILFGKFSGSIDFDPGLGVFNMVGSGDGFILLMTSSGDFTTAWNLDQTAVGFVEITEVRLIGTDDIVLAGYFRGTVDFDPSTGTYPLTSTPPNGLTDGFVARLSTSGQFQWAGVVGGPEQDVITDMDVTGSNEILLTGWFEGIADLDPTVNVVSFTSNGSSDVFFSRLDQLGQIIVASTIGGSGPDQARSITSDVAGNSYITGQFSGTVDFDPSQGEYNLQSPSGSGGFIGKWDGSNKPIWVVPYSGVGMDLESRPYKGLLTIGTYWGQVDFDPAEPEYNLPDPGGSFLWALGERGVVGSVWNDVIQDCTQSFVEPGLEGRIIEISPNGIIAQTNALGRWMIDSLTPGIYVAKVDHGRGPWIGSCEVEHVFEVTDSIRLLVVPPFGLVSTEPCPMPDISIYAPTMRRCDPNQRVYVRYCNQLAGSSVLSNASVDLSLHPYYTITGANLPITDLGNDSYRLDVGDLYPGQCGVLVLTVSLSCNAVLGETLCIDAELHPQTACVFDTIPGTGTCSTSWDGSEIKVDSYCLEDTVHFTIQNVAPMGTGDMLCYSMVRIYLDGVLFRTDSVQLAGGESFTFSFPGNGQTWRLEADQHPLHPGNSRPNAVQERCGPIENWTPRLIATQYMDDADPVIDIYCGVVSGSFDPNDKIGYPTGLTDEHFILPRQQLQYMIRFQNTGNDTAFTVIIRDTLDTALDVFTVVPGVASHPYTFRIYGSRVLEWTFENILLPDSTTDSPGSNGFVTYRVDQLGELPNWTVIRNVAAIYFDYNEPVLTEPIIHTVHDMSEVATMNGNASKTTEGIRVFPNPTHDGLFYCEFVTAEACTLTVFDTHGRLVRSRSVSTGQRRAALDLNDEPAGMYFLEHNAAGRRSTCRLIKY